MAIVAVCELTYEVAEKMKSSTDVDVLGDNHPVMLRLSNVIWLQDVWNHCYRL